MNPKTRECTLDTLRPEQRKQIQSQLSSDETPLICCETNYEGWMSTAVYYAYMISGRRVVASRISRDELGSNVSSIFLTDVTGVSEYDYKGTHGVDIRGHGENRMRFYFEADDVLVKFRDILQNAINRAKETPSQTQTMQSKKSPAERLRELVQLHQDGFITDAEFEQKRKEILRGL